MVKSKQTVKQVITRILGCGRGSESGNAHKIFAWNRNLLQIFDGLKRDYGYAEVSNGYKDSTTGKFKVKHGWAGKATN